MAKDVVVMKRKRIPHGKIVVHVEDKCVIVSVFHTHATTTEHQAAWLEIQQKDGCGIEGLKYPVYFYHIKSSDFDEVEKKLRTAIKDAEYLLYVFERNRVEEEIKQAKIKSILKQIKSEFTNGAIVNGQDDGGGMESTTTQD